MTTAVARIGSALRIGRAWAWALCGAGLVALAGAVAAATYLHALPLLLALAGAGVLTALCFRWPILGLWVFAALIPIEILVLIDGVGTITRFAGILFAVTYGVPRLARLTLAPLPVAGWALIAWAALSAGWAIDAFRTWTQLATLLQLFVVAVLIADFVVQRPGSIRSVLWVYTLSASATAIVGFLSYLGTESRSAVVEGQDPALFAAGLLPALLFGLHELVSGTRKLSGAAIALLTTIGIIVSGTRGAWLAGAVAIAVFLLPRLGRRRGLIAAAAIAVIGVVLLQVPGVADLLVERVGTAVDTGGAGRGDIWHVAETIYLGHPVLGVGYANFPLAYTSEAVRATAVEYTTLTARAPHNIAVGTLVELGPLGLLLLGLFLGPLLLRRYTGPDAVPVRAALAALIVLTLFLDLFGQSKGLWLMIGLAAGLSHVGRQQQDHAPDAVGSEGRAQPEARLAAS